MSKRAGLRRLLLGCIGPLLIIVSSKPCMVSMIRERIAFLLARIEATATPPALLSPSVSLLGQQFLGCFTRPPAWPKQIVSMPWRWLRSFLISFERPKIGSPS